MISFVVQTVIKLLNKKNIKFFSVVLNCRDLRAPRQNLSYLWLKIMQSYIILKDLYVCNKKQMYGAEYC